MNRYRENINFLLLIIGKNTSKFGNIIYDVALVYWIVEKTNSAKMFGIITSVALLPEIILSFFSGVAVDKFNKKIILIITDIVSGIVCIICSFVVKSSIINLPALVVVSFFLGSCNALFSPAIKAILPEIVSKEKLIKYNGISTTISQITSVITPMIAGVFLSVLGLNISILLVLNGITFFVSAIFELFISYQSNAITIKNEKYLESFINGLKYLKSSDIVLRLVIISAVVNFFITSYAILLPLCVNNNFSGMTALYGNALALQSLGGILAGLSIFIKFIKLNELKSIKLSLFLIGVSMIILYFHSQIIICISNFLFGFSLSRFNILFFTIVQKNVDEKYMGRVLSIIILIALSIMPIGNLIFATLGDYILEPIFIISGISIILATKFVKMTSYNKIEI